MSEYKLDEIREKIKHHLEQAYKLTLEFLDGHEGQNIYNTSVIEEMEEALPTLRKIKRNI